MSNEQILLAEHIFYNYISNMISFLSMAAMVLFLVTGLCIAIWTIMIIKENCTDELMRTNTITQIILEIIYWESYEFRTYNDVSFFWAAILWVLMYLVISPVFLPVLVTIVLICKVGAVVQAWAIQTWGTTTT